MTDQATTGAPPTPLEWAVKCAAWNSLAALKAVTGKDWYVNER